MLTAYLVVRSDDTGNFSEIDQNFTAFHTLDESLDDLSLLRFEIIVNIGAFSFTNSLD
jgi:hypothetical protein